MITLTRCSRIVSIVVLNARLNQGGMNISLPDPYKAWANRKCHAWRDALDKYV